MTTLEMEVAIMDFLNPYNDVIVPNVSHGLLTYEADIVKLTSSGYATEIEIKISKSDFNADFKKKRFHDSPLFKYFYYAVPKTLVDYVLPKLPERAGLYSVEPCVYQYRENGRLYEEAGYSVSEVVAPKVNPLHRKWKKNEQEKLVRLGCMRILTLKINLLRQQGKMEKVARIKEMQEEACHTYINHLYEIIGYGKRFREHPFYSDAVKRYEIAKKAGADVIDVEGWCNRYLVTGETSIIKKSISVN